MVACKKLSVIEKVLSNIDTDSKKLLVSFANQLNGQMELYNRGKLLIRSEDHQELNKAYEMVMRRISGGRLELSYVAPKSEVKVIHKIRRY